MRSMPLFVCVLALLATSPVGVLAQEAAPTGATAAAPEANKDKPVGNCGKAGTQAEDVAARLATRIADQLKSPFCPGKTLTTCTSGQAFEVRAEIKRRLMDCEAEESIISDLAYRFGNEIRNPPQPWYTFLVPIMPFVLGAGLLGVAVMTWRRKGQGGDDAEPGSEVDLETDEAQARLARLRAQVRDQDD